MNTKKLEYIKAYRGCEIFIKRTKTPLYYVAINGKKYMKASIKSCEELADKFLARLTND